MKLLPKWVLTGGLPASTDHESATCIEQTYKLYGAMQDLITDYNAFADKVNADILAHKEQYESDWETYQTSFRQEFQDFIDVVDLKIAELESENIEFKNQAIEELTNLKTSIEERMSVFEDENAVGTERLVDGSVTINKLDDKIVESIENASILTDVTEKSTLLQQFINKNGVFETFGTYSCRELNISGGEIFYLTGRYWNNGPLYAFYKDDELLCVGELGGETHDIIEDVRVVAPFNANKLYLNIGQSSNGIFGKNTIKTYDEFFNKIGEEKKYINDYINYDIRGTSLVNQNNKNPFKYSEFDKPYFVMVFDDGRRDLDLVASICEEYNIPLSVSIPPHTLNYVCDGLTESKGSYSVGMSIKEVCNKIVELGGEVLAHRLEVITIDNQYNNEFMYDHFVNTKKELEENGFKIRGIIRAGGGNAIDNSEEQTKESLKWCLKFYDYSDMYAPRTNIQYGRPRNNFYNGVEESKAIFDNLLTYYKTDFKWLMAHTLDGTETNMNEANFRAIIEYALSIGVTFTTMSYLFDNFKSSELEERIKALEN